MIIKKQAFDLLKLRASLVSAAVTYVGAAAAASQLTDPKEKGIPEVGT